MTKGKWEEEEGKQDGEKVGAWEEDEPTVK